MFFDIERSPDFSDKTDEDMNNMYNDKNDKKKKILSAIHKHENDLTRINKELTYLVNEIETRRLKKELKQKNKFIAMLENIKKKLNEETDSIVGYSVFLNEIYISKITNAILDLDLTEDQYDNQYEQYCMKIIGILRNYSWELLSIQNNKYFKFTDGEHDYLVEIN